MRVAEAESSVFPLERSKSLLAVCRSILRTLEKEDWLVFVVRVSEEEEEGVIESLESSAIAR